MYIITGNFLLISATHGVGLCCYSEMLLCMHFTEFLHLGEIKLKGCYLYCCVVVMIISYSTRLLIY